MWIVAIVCLIFGYLVGYIHCYMKVWKMVLDPEYFEHSDAPQQNPLLELEAEDEQARRSTQAGCGEQPRS